MSDELNVPLRDQEQLKPADVIELDSHRYEGTPPAECPACGGQWFILAGPSSPPGYEHGALTLDRAGSVTGYVGTPKCAECARSAGALTSLQSDPGGSNDSLHTARLH